MFSIGKFSKLTGVSSKTLIWYDKVGILKPARVDINNGYRYYDDENLKKLVNIKFLQTMGFTVKEIVNFSKEIIENKINQLEEEMRFISFNIYLLKNKREDKMRNDEMSIFDVETKVIQGKWRYLKSSTDFKDIIDIYKKAKEDENLPKYLFFGKGNFATDLNETFGYTENCFSLTDKRNNKKDFWFFIVNYKDTLVLYEKPKSSDRENKKIAFHIYDRVNSNNYTTQDIQYLFNKKLNKQLNMTKFNKNFVGFWKIYDEIKESMVEKYDGSIIEEKAAFTLSPIFDCLEIFENKDVFIMENGKKLEIKSGQNEKIFTRENTKLRIEMYGDDEQDFIINNTLIKEKHLGKYRNIGNDEFMFVNLSNNIDLDESVFVFKKIKGE